MNVAPPASRVGAALQRFAASIGASAAGAPIAVAGRAADRAAGLTAASHALDAAGCTEPHVLGHEDDGRPRWPAGFTGSIAHAAHVAVAVASAGSGALGVDVEVAGALPARDADAVLDTDERALVGRATRADDLATLLWSAKEAAFKAWSTATAGGLGDVDPVDIHVDLDVQVDHAPGEPIGVRVEARGPLAERTAAVGALWGWTVQVDGYAVVLVTAGPRRGQPVDGMASAAITRPSAANATT